MNETARAGLKVPILHWSATGNTEKVAKAVKRGVMVAKAQVRLERITEERHLEL